MVCLSCGKTALPQGAVDATTGLGGAAGAGSIAGSGGATSDGGCLQTRIDSTQAAAAYAAYAGLASSETIQAEEDNVPLLWEAMHAQLFTTKRYYEGMPATRACSFIYRECVLTLPTGDCTLFGPLVSGVVANGAFYYSWGWGSGIYRTHFGRLAPSGGALVQIKSGGYTIFGDDPPPLVVAFEGGQILVYRPARSPSDFNQWQGGDLVGTLKDLGDRLAIVDRSGQEIPASFP
jgi:hypothetical protein